MVGNHPTDEPSDPLMCLRLDELFEPDLIVEELAVPFVHFAAIVQKLLQGFCEVVIIAVVELFHIE